MNVSSLKNSEVGLVDTAPARSSHADTPWIVRSLWVGPPLSEMEWACFASFVKHGARFELFTDDLSRQVPEGVILRDCREVLGSEIPRYGPQAGERAGSYAIAGDVARVRTLVRDGGWWVDSDVVCLRSFAPIDKGMQFAWQDTPGSTSPLGSVNVAVIRLPPGTPIARLLERRARMPWFGSPWESPKQRLRNFWRNKRTLANPYNVWWGMSAGPDALTRAIHHFGLTSHVLPHEAFYPVHYSDWRAMLTKTDDDLASMAKDSYAIHLWAEMYRDVGLSKGEAVRRSPWAASLLEGYRT